MFVNYYLMKNIKYFILINGGVTKGFRFLGRGKEKLDKNFRCVVK